MRTTCDSTCTADCGYCKGSGTPRWLPRSRVLVDGQHPASVVFHLVNQPTVVILRADGNTDLQSVHPDRLTPLED